METNLKQLLVSSVLALLTACGNNTSTSNGINSSTTVSLTGSPLGNAPSNAAQAADAYTPQVNGQKAESPMKVRDMSAVPVATHIALGAPVANQSATFSSQATNNTEGKPFQIGFARDVAQTGTPSLTKQALKWQANATGGRVAALNFNSTSAKGLRIGLVVTQLSAGATLRFYAKGAVNAYEVNGADATIEIELPGGLGAWPTLDLPSFGFLPNRHYATWLARAFICNGFHGDDFVSEFICV
jgi:lysyl endopeptidase